MVTVMSLSDVMMSIYLGDIVMSIILYYFTNTFFLPIDLLQFSFFRECTLGINRYRRS